MITDELGAGTASGMTTVTIFRKSG